MKLQSPFSRLPIRFDVTELQRELAQFPESAWQQHPQGHAGNSALRLISTNGQENDDVRGQMMPTPHLMQCEYVRQVLSSFKSVFSRSRFMRLAPKSVVPLHCDINYHWYNRVRIHIPIVTHPDVKFICNGLSVHMAAGEAWIFDNWLPHTVENHSSVTRVHLVADTAGSSYFWDMVRRAQTEGFQEQPIATSFLKRNTNGIEHSLATERFGSHDVMPPGELDALCDDLLSDMLPPLAGHHETGHQQFISLVTSFKQEWRALWYTFGDSPIGRRYFKNLLNHLYEQLSLLANGPVTRSNDQSVRGILMARVAKAALSPAVVDSHTLPTLRKSSKIRDYFDRPVFIISSPRAGSTLLYETLSCAQDFCTIGGESHAVIESIKHLCPANTGAVSSNRLTQHDVTTGVESLIRKGFMDALVDAAGHPIEIDEFSRIRFLEKTPKNSLRIPFINRIFPDALFVYLYRDPWQNISSMIDAWDSGNWVTYPVLSDHKKPWSLLLPPDWSQYKDEATEVIAAHQWAAANTFSIDDLNELPESKILAVSYEALINSPFQTVESICNFSDISFDSWLRDRAAGKLPLSKFTQTAPTPDKWKKNIDRLQRVEHIFSPTWNKVTEFSLRHRRG